MGPLIPREYWKLIAYRAPDDGLTSAVFILSQEELLNRDLREMDFSDFRVSQESLTELEERTDLDFSAYAKSDVLENRGRICVGRDLSLTERVQQRGREIHSLDDIVF